MAFAHCQVADSDVCLAVAFHLCGYQRSPFGRLGGIEFEIPIVAQILKAPSTSCKLETVPSGIYMHLYRECCIVL